eukprot:CAMPEP_0183433804 /NCGR_PEP_ID=MMETSP0370-20130417/61633_1 /TAXON_ID=268820 /ORGANISM="Peridinium aciculiferum, Strain PAER-2" /LENGTH=92 /DNA_ID=CAMNT_0025620243 /DNA_START=373 /DNA_END=648 /DNA_ORIENTATION=-
MFQRRAATFLSLPALLKGAGEQRTKCAPVMLSEVSNTGSVAKCKVQKAPWVGFFMKHIATGLKILFSLTTTGCMSRITSVKTSPGWIWFTGI